MKKNELYICVKSAVPYPFQVGEVLKINSVDVDPECGLEFARYINPQTDRSDYVFTDILQECFVLLPQVRPNDIWEKLNQ